MSQLPIKPLNSRFTDGQWQSIYESGHNILVSASAGSGKTTVLVQRVIEKIKAGVNVDDLLIVTYTEAAAREMKERIKTAIQQAITSESNPEQKQHLVRQMSLLTQASISTLHAFCLQVIRRYYFLIDLDPIFRLLTDETEIILLKEAVWEEVRESLYGSETNSFHDLARAYSNDRSDVGLTDLIFSLYEFSRANPDPAYWLDHLYDLYENELESFSKGTLFQKLLKPQMSDILISLNELDITAAEIGDGAEELAKQTEIVASEAAHFAEVFKLIQADAYQDAYQLVQSFEFIRWKPVKKSVEDSLIEAGSEMKVFRDQAKTRYGEMKEAYFNTPLEKQIDMMSKAIPLVQEMARVTKIFTQAYRERKNERNLLDFNDLEHLTLQILAKNEEQKWTPTEASIHYREKFKEVMIDEYQDINQLQENIMYWLTQDNTKDGNLFMVGDVKQSIYSFRLADPGLFLEKYEQYGERNGGERIILAENFRSRGEILQFTNLIFEQIMDKSVGQMDYNEPAKLIQGFNDFPETNQHATEILIYEKGKETTDEDSDEESLDYDMQIEDKTQGELLMVGQKIQQLIQEEFPIYDKKLKCNRPIKYQDIVLLTPTKKNNLVLLEIFNRLSIPLHVNDTQNYFQTTEITIMMSLLKIIDNPYQDIPLAAVLRSPIVGLNENELASIRISQKTGDYYEALNQFYASYPGEDKASAFTTALFHKIDLFLTHLKKWREEARREHLVGLIWSIYKDTHFLDYVGGMSSGRQRKANLHALYERAASYEQTSFKGLFQFVRFIEKMQEKDKDLAEPKAIAADEDAVRVMTIHASKGLEFPVVFVLDLTKQFNLQDIRKSYLFNEVYGVGTEYKDQESHIRYPSLPGIALKVERKAKLLSEEMRKLYVALTRAEEKLFLIGSYKDEESAYKEWGIIGGHQPTVLPSDIRLTATSLMKWVGLSLMRHSDGENDFLSITANNVYVKNHPAKFSIHFYDESMIQEQMIQEDLEIDEKWVEKLDASVSKNKLVIEEQELLDEAVALMDYSYRYERSTHTTSYQSVSEIKRLFEEPADELMVKIDVNQPRNQNRYVEDKLLRPRFMAEMSAPTNAEIGTATHLVMQSINLFAPVTASSITELIMNLADRGMMQSEVAEKIESDKIIHFFESQLGQLLLTYPQQVKREAPFSLLIKADRIFTDLDPDAEDNVLIHGIIDGYLEYENELILFDYKTDQVAHYGPTAGEKMLEKYKGQMNLYRNALELILNKPVTQAYLCLLANNELVSVP
ncbi:helicase-exonuclease AddAB subunit AddA [Carnobacterium funditum]|uniref:helicase-exonuclease AddAB subunit AddA n=1 Tax=Carnobacterium funditum TaxID=2752 RepID=UPI0005550B50|nr:helicase-exonuclease AddAB subunit AddA [Carnobacterium funditum]